MERESLKEYSEATIVEKRRALCDEVLLQATSYSVALRLNVCALFSQF